MFEHRSSPLLPRRQFVHRLARSGLFAALIIVVSLLVGMAGYHWFEHMPWIDAFANAAMILSGMGPVNPLKTDGGKIFAGMYALYSGLALIGVAGVIFAPAVHRFLHRFHLDEESKKRK
ncbi:MAG TPA: hypothetical protein VGQ19_07655 [Burkholderiales bacterium]|nr:hypothetical protein [Burkholderiales bacterium]